MYHSLRIGSIKLYAGHGLSSTTIGLQEVAVSYESNAATPATNTTIEPDNGVAELN